MKAPRECYGPDSPTHRVFGLEGRTEDTPQQLYCSSTATDPPSLWSFGIRCAAKSRQSRITIKPERFSELPAETLVVDGMSLTLLVSHFEHLVRSRYHPVGRVGAMIWVSSLQNNICSSRCQVLIRNAWRERSDDTKNLTIVIA